MDFLLSSGWKIWTDDQGQVWSQGPSGIKELLQDKDSLCGHGIFSTSFNDIFRPACGDHDRWYQNRGWYEQLFDWNREIIDKMFLNLMLYIAKDDLLLRIEAHDYYAVVRMAGGFYYYHHPGKPNMEMTASGILSQTVSVPDIGSGLYPTPDEILLKERVKDSFSNATFQSCRAVVCPSCGALVSS